jgi:hypothetical protein
VSGIFTLCLTKINKNGQIMDAPIALISIP